MQILFLDNVPITAINNNNLWKPMYIHNRLLKMPCKVYMEHSKDIEELSKECQIVIMNYGGKGINYRHEITFLNNSNILKMQYHIDPWNAVAASPIRLDYVITPCKALFKRFNPFFWSPACTNLYPEAAIRDIDIVLWGNINRHYPFRQFIIKQLDSLVVSGPVIKDKAYYYIIKLGNREYTYVKVPLISYFYSTRLYDLLARSKICVTGCGRNAPHAKYFENAACGGVTLTNSFTDMNDLGFEHGKNLWVTTETMFLTDLQFLLEDNILVNQLSINSRDLIANRHTIDIRAQELYKFFTEVTGVV